MSQRKILVVDDEAPVRGLIRSALSISGNQVMEAADGNVALQLAGQQGFFDLVVTDILMPGMDGIELAQRLQRDRNARRFLFISGYAQFDSLDHTLEEFETAFFLSKPFAIPELLRVVHSLCERPLAAESSVIPPQRRPAGA